MSKERPILFSAPMVRAILSGAKHQTRRLVKHPNVVDIDAWADAGGGLWEMGVHEAGSTAGMGKLRCPYGAPGDRLWVRETWAPCEAPILRGHIQYAADGAVMVEQREDGAGRWMGRSGHTMGISDGNLTGQWVARPTRWRPSIHMPRWASRIDLEVTAVRVERLQAITEADAKAEGVDCAQELMGRVRWWDYLHEDHRASTAVESFRTLWSSINGPESWSANPFCWVVEFRRVRP